jgi:hypothetical protein
VGVAARGLPEIRATIANYVRLMLALAFVLSLAAASPPAAKAATVPPGVQVDPGSPAGKEYAIPLAQARGGGTSGGRLFGRGITRAPTTVTTAPTTVTTPSVPPAASRSVATGATRSGQARAARHGSPTIRSAGDRTVSQTYGVPAAQVSRAERLAAGGSGILWMVGVAALVLALGGLGGTALARRSPGASTRTS